MVWEMSVRAPFREKEQVEWRLKENPVSDMQRDPEGYWSLKAETRVRDQYRIVWDEEVPRPHSQARDTFYRSKI